MSKLAVLSVKAISFVNFREHLVRDILDRGHTVLAFAPDFNDDTRNAVREMGAIPVSYSLSRSGMNPFGDLSDLLKLIRLLKTHKPDLIFASMAKPVVLGMLAAKIIGVPRRYAMIEGLGYAFTETGMRRTLKQFVSRIALQFLYKSAFKFADKVFFLNRDDKEDFLGIKLIASQRVCLIDGIGIDLNRWRQSEPATKPLCFLMIARLMNSKGVPQFIEAARQIKSKYPETRFVLLGSIEGSPDALNAQDVDSIVNDGLIEWPGRVDVREYLEQSSVFVLPSYYREGLPRSSLEALATGRAIITTDSPGCRETVMNGKNGFLVQPRKVGELVSAMEKFINTPDLVRTMGEASRELAESRFDIQEINKSIVEQMGL